MTGYQSKKAAALDEEGMYLVHHTKHKIDEDDDDIQVYKRPWVGLTDEDRAEILSRKWWNFEDTFDVDGFLRLTEAKLKVGFR
jgi:hypothetical protein